MDTEVEFGDGTEDKGSMWALEQQLDQPMDEEAERVRNMYREKKVSALLLLRLAFQSLGVVFGDLGTSPLYVFHNTFPRGIGDPEDVIGALSLIIYSLTLIPLLKYVFIVCRANDNGQGGTFALYSLLCRHAKIKTIPNQHRTDEELTTYSRNSFHEHSYAAKTKAWLEKYTFRKNALLLLVLVGTCMAIGDGILTPAISVLSAAGGIKVAHPKMSSESIYWPVFVVATFAAIVASQATISATFSIIEQALALGCFPRVKVVHTSEKFLGQIYIPDMNWILMILCIAVTVGFKHQIQIGNAYGTAVMIVMLVTTLLMPLIMLLVWHRHWMVVLIFSSLSLVVECTYFSAVLFKVGQGGWVPLVIAAAFLLIMYTWHYATMKRYEFEMHSRVSMAWLLGLGPGLGLVRVPGVGLVYTELASGVPHIFSHFITNLPAIHSVVVFVCVKYLPVYTVPEEERFLVRRIGPKNFHMFRCVARYGYKDLHKKDEDFEKKLFDNLFLFVQLESMMEGCSDSEYSWYGHQNERPRDFLLKDNANTVSSKLDRTISSAESIVQGKSPTETNHTVMSGGKASNSNHTEVDEFEFLSNCRAAGVVHILGNTVVSARRDSNIFKKIAVDYIYAFLRKICRDNSGMFNVPHESLLNVGQIFYV
ncbi:potassium transporter 10-like isoform X6 [Diospyros lotus]|uniref:potassium transporter 10-like isoform X6 n=1 Tax=Diospyros lotus TaxID=55363 RepID=UPI00225216C7|nr:potassium transporter 10-like isoform X6 [Diospyros lotus]